MAKKMKREDAVRTLIAGIAISAGIVYLLSPGKSGRRIALLQDKAVHTFPILERSAGIIKRGFISQAHSIAAQIRPNRHRRDELLVPRVRAKLGRWVSHRVRFMKHIAGVDNGLVPHEGADILQAGPKQGWGPVPRVVAGTLGVTMAVYGARKRGLLGIGIATGGVLLTARSITNTELLRLIGLRSSFSINMQQAIMVNASQEHVFSVWSEYEAFPQFMSHVKRIEDCGKGLFRWIIEVSPGLTTEFVARITDWIVNRELAWKTEPGSLVRHKGMIRIAPSNGGTSVQVRVSCIPPPGIAGRLLAALIGTDPNVRLSQELARMKHFIETRTPPRDAAS